ncbi:MAG: hypothetical protein U0840_17235 [Gemmataceae bacterium]
MFYNPIASAFLRLFGQPAFQIHGRSRHERDWRIIDVHATHRRNLDSRWPRPFFAGTCITWTSSIIAVGWDFAETVLLEQFLAPASREHPIEVQGGRLHDDDRRTRAGARLYPTASEVLAHEIGHTYQARRLSWLYLPTGALFTLYREGPHWYNRFENQASEDGLFGGIVNGSVCPALMQTLPRPSSDR